MIEDDINGGPNYLAQWRNKFGLSQAQLAERVGTTQGMIAHLEGDRRGLSAKWLRKIADALDITAGWLLDVNPNEVPSDLIDIWGKANDTQRRQIAEIAQTLVRGNS